MGYLFSKNGDAKYKYIYQEAINDSSYSVAGAALKGLVALDGESAYAMAKKYGTGARGALAIAANEILIEKGTEADFDLIASFYKQAPASQEKVMATTKFGSYLSKLNDIQNVKTGIDYMMDFRSAIPEQYHMYIDPTFKTAFDKIGKAKGAEIENYIKSVFK